MSENRDMRRINKACTSVQGNITTLMNRDSLLLIEKSLKRSIDGNMTGNEKNNQRKLVCLALDSGKLSNNLFNKSQTNTTKQSAQRYANNQHKRIIKSFKLGEDISSIKSISPYIATGKYSVIQFVSFIFIICPDIK